MKITFMFHNGTSQIHLAPENPRDERYLDLCVEGRTQVKVLTSKDKAITLEFKQEEKMNANELRAMMLPVLVTKESEG